MDIDGKNHVLGRLATSTVEELKKGKEVHIFNAEKVIVKGSPKQTVETYRQKYNRGSRDHGPYFPKNPRKIVKRTIKGMLPNNKKGRNMLKNVKTYAKEPEGDAKVFQEALEEDLRGSNFITIKEISDQLGA